MILYPMKQLL